MKDNQSLLIFFLVGWTRGCHLSNGEGRKGEEWGGERGDNKPRRTIVVSLQGLKAKNIRYG